MKIREGTTKNTGENSPAQASQTPNQKSYWSSTALSSRVRTNLYHLILGVQAGKAHLHKY